MNFGPINKSKSNGTAKNPLSIQSGALGSDEVSGSAHEMRLGVTRPPHPASHFIFFIAHLGPLSVLSSSLYISGDEQ